MKKYLKIVICFMFIILLTGCSKYNAEMNIHKDKRMSFKMNVLVNKDLITNERSMAIDDAFMKIINQDLMAEIYDEDNLYGLTISKIFENIDKVSGKEDVVFSLSDIDKYTTDSKIFKVEKGFIKNTYYADFTFDYNDIEEAKYFINDNSKFKFNVNIDGDIISTNGTNNNNNITWDLNVLEHDNIKFVFSLYNYNYIYGTIVFIVLFIIVTIVTIFNLIIKKLYERRSKRLSEKYYREFRNFQDSQNKSNRDLKVKKKVKKEEIKTTDLNDFYNNNTDGMDFNYNEHNVNGLQANKVDKNIIDNNGNNTNNDSNTDLSNLYK